MNSAAFTTGSGGQGKGDAAGACSLNPPPVQLTILLLCSFVFYAHHEDWLMAK